MSADEKNPQDPGPEPAQPAGQTPQDGQPPAPSGDEAPDPPDFSPEETERAIEAAFFSDPPHGDPPAPTEPPTDTPEAQAQADPPAAEPQPAVEPQPEAPAAEAQPAVEPQPEAPAEEAQPAVEPQPEAPAAEAQPEGEPQTAPEAVAEADDLSVGVDVDVDVDPPEAEPTIEVSLAADAQGKEAPLPVAGGPGSQPAPFDPRKAPVWQTLLAEYERELAAIGEVPAAATLHYESGRIWEEKLAQPRNAWQAYNRAFQLQPALLPNIRAARRLASQVGNWNVCVQIIDSEVEAISDPTHKAHLLHSKGLVLEEKLGQLEEAKAAYEAALSLAPTNLELLSQVERLAITTNDWQKVLEVRAQTLAQVSDPGTITQLLLSSACILRIHFNDPKRAEEHYERVLQLDPENRIALRAMRQIYAETRRWEKLLETLYTEAGLAAEPPVATNLYYQAARILREQMGDEDKALEALTRALGLSPDDHMILGEMAQLYENLLRWQELVEIYERQVQVISDRQELVSLYFKLGNIWEEKLFNEDRAIPHYRKVVELNPNYLPALQALGKLFYRKGQWDDLVSMYEVEIRDINDQKQVISLLHRNGEIYEEKLNDKDRAIETYKEVLALSPAYLPALQSLGRLYFIKGLWDDLIAMFRQEIEVTQNEAQQISLLYKIGELFEEKLVKEDQAIEAYREVLEIQAGNFPALKALIRIYANKRDWENLLQVLEQEASALEDPNQQALSLFRVAEIWEVQLDNPDRAIETLRRILQLVESHGPSIQALVRLYSQQRDWRELLGIHERELAQTTSEARQVQILFRMAEIHAEEVNDLVRAAETYEKILTIRPGHTASLEALERIYLAQRNYQALIRVYSALAERSTDAQLQISLHSQLADLKENRLQPPQNAAEHYLKILEIDPTHPEAARALDILYHKFGTWHGLRMLYERELRRVRSSQEALDLCIRIADLAETRLQQPEVAIHYYQEALRLDPDYLPAIKALKRIHMATDDAQAMIRLLDREGQVTRDPTQAITTLLQAGELYRDRFNDPHRAIECFFKVLERDPKEVQAFGQLEDLLLKQEDWERAAVMYQNRVRVTDDSRALAELHLKLGGLLQDKLQRSQDAATSYREVLRINPSHLPALIALARISFQSEDWDDAIGLANRILDLTNEPEQQADAHLKLGMIYQEKQPDLDRAVEHLTKAVEIQPSQIDALRRLLAIHVARQQWNEAVAVLDKLIEADADNRLQHLMAKAELYETGLSDPDKAVEAFQGVLQLEPDNVAVIQKLGELYERLERWPELIDGYHKFISLLPPDRQREAIPLHMKIGGLYAEQLDNTDKAILEYKRVTEIDPANQEAHVALAELYGKTGLYYANAIDEHRKLLQMNPFRLDSYHELRRIFEEQRAFDKVFCACAVLHYLRAADQNEEFFYGENTGKAPERSSEVLTPEEIERLLVHPGERGIVRQIMQIVGPHLGKLYPPDLARHGVGKGDRARPDDPLRKLADSMVANLGALNYDIYRSTQPSHLVACLNTSPLGLVAGEGLVKRTQVKEQRFALGRALKRLMDGSFLATQIGAAELAKLIAAAVSPHHPSSPVATFPSELPPDLPKKVSKALPRKSRKALEELLKREATALARVPDYEAYLRGAEHSANRVGLALSNDLANAIMHISREIPELDGKRLNTTEEMTAAFARHPVLCELLRFAVSEEYFTLRTRLKMSILG